MTTDDHHEGSTEVVRAAAEVARARDRFALSVRALQREITRRLEWRDWVRRRPITALALAFGLGVFLGRRN